MENPNLSMAGKVALVTGGSRGLGRAMTLGFARAGADVIIASRKFDSCKELATEIEQTIGRRAVPIAANVGNWEDCDALYRAAYEAFPRVDVLVNNAGVGTAVPATRETPEEFRTVIDINLNGSYWAAQACGRVMRPGSSIVNISSILGITTASLPQAAYSASKAGVIGLTRDLAQQWTPRKGIRVNAIAPGFFKSEMTDQYKPGYLDSQMPRVLMGRTGDPEELAATLVWLVSDAGGYVTGQTIVVDGGITIT